jgi:hypothetical protein
MEKPQIAGEPPSPFVQVPPDTCPNASKRSRPNWNAGPTPMSPNKTAERRKDPDDAEAGHDHELDRRES